MKQVRDGTVPEELYRVARVPTPRALLLNAPRHAPTSLHYVRP